MSKLPVEAKPLPQAKSDPKLAAFLAGRQAAREHEFMPFMTEGMSESFNAGFYAEKTLQGQHQSLTVADLRVMLDKLPPDLPIGKIDLPESVMANLAKLFSLAPPITRVPAQTKRISSTGFRQYDSQGKTLDELGL